MGSTNFKYTNFEFVSVDLYQDAYLKIQKINFYSRWNNCFCLFVW